VVIAQIKLEFTWPPEEAITAKYVPSEDAPLDEKG